MLAQADAATCPFDTGGSDAVNDGVVLTRYALGITGAPLTASTRYASLDPLQVKANIECVGCALDVNQDGVVDTVDTTIIARHLAGFKGTSVTNGLGLTPPVAASVTSFLANGCAVGGAINAFVHGGNMFALGAGVASVLGNNDNRPLTVKAPQSAIKLLVDPANGDDGLRISYATNGTVRSPNTVQGSMMNSAAPGVLGGTIAGGGFFTPISDPEPNEVLGHFGSIGGGANNSVGPYGAVAGGKTNRTGGDFGAVGGGYGNFAQGRAATIPGGEDNSASGMRSFAAGYSSQAVNDGAFVWADNSGAGASSTGVNQFVIRASGGIRLPGAGENQPGNSAKQSGTNMFTHVVPTSVPCGSSAARTVIEHPLTNLNPNSILVVTNLGSTAGAAQAYPSPVGVYYETGPGGCTVGRWVIFSLAGTPAMAAGQRFNVFVINP